MIKKLIALFFLILFLFHFTAGASPAELYESAKKAYYEQNYQEAEEIFENLLQEELNNPYLFYDLGNTFFQQGQLGKAIRYYEKAYQSLPRFSDLKLNLNLSRGKLVDKIEISFWEYLYGTFYFWVKWVSHNELQILLVIISLVFWGDLIFLFSKKRSFWKIRHVLFVLFYIYLLIGHSISSELREKPYGTVLPVEMQVRASYLDTEKTLFLLHEGTKVRLIDEQNFGEDRWLRIALPQGQKGWVKAEEIGKI